MKRMLATMACTLLVISVQGCGGGGGGGEDTTTDTASDTTDTAGDTSVTDTAEDTPADTAGDTAVTDTLEDSAGDTSSDTPGDSEEDGEVTCTLPATSCNDLALSGSVVPEMQVASDAPALTGGTIIAGTYVLTSLALYTGAGGATGPTGDSALVVMVFSDGSFDRIDEKHTPTECRIEEVSGTYSAAAGEVSVSMTCPETMSFTTAYQADSTTLIIQDAADEQSTFTRE